jgi:hypothetical protein
MDERLPWSVQGESLLSFYVVGVQHNLLLPFRASSFTYLDFLATVLVFE